MAIATTSLEATLTFVSPLKRDARWHRQCLRYRLKKSTNFKRKMPTFKDVKFFLIDDVTKIWIRATLPILINSQIEMKLNKFVEK